MKKLCLLSGIIAFTAVLSMNANVINTGNTKKYPGGITEEERQNIENIQWGRIERQKELARPAIYKMIDSLIKSEWNAAKDMYEYIIEWAKIFGVIDSMQGAISVNEYKTTWGDPLLWLAVDQENFLATKTLLEKYHANPNISGCLGEHGANEVCIKKSLVSLARRNKDLAIVILLRQHGANL
jgi:hypothetical protein